MSKIWKLQVCRLCVVRRPPVVSAVFGQENVGDAVLLAWLWWAKILNSKGSLTKSKLIPGKLQS